MLNRATRNLLAAIQAIIGWEWLMSGGNKLLSGTFPQGLANALNKGIKDNPNNWYIAFLQHTVLPQSIFYGYLIEWTEVTVGVILLSGSLILLGQPRVAGESQHRLAVAFSIAVAIAAAVAAVMAVNFHFWMGGWVIPTFNPTAPYNEGIDLDGLLPALSLVIIIANIALIQEMTVGNLLKHIARFAHVSEAPALAQMEKEQQTLHL